MDFESYKSIATSWTEGSDISFRICSFVETERKIVFQVPDTAVSFFIICPDPADKTSRWVVWSDSDDVIMKLQSVQDFIESCKEKPLPDILNKVNSELIPLDVDADEEESFENDDYYQEEDIDVMETELRAAKSSVDDDEEKAENFFGAGGDAMAVKRLLKDLKVMQNAKQFGIEGSPRADNLFVWDVKLMDLPKDSRLGKDLEAFAKKHNREPVIYMEMQFPGDYPMSPPFVRVIRPRFKFLTGHVTIGGSICMEMLTKSGWRPINDIESILVQIRSEIMSDSNAQLDGNPDKCYTEDEARDAFNRMVQRYGWNK
ncbi:hypothetical protein ACJMK2_010223 [Sinanodonta woodiana]|uniref:Maturin n=1 Tax=Sinanodonta woodiana TaxID=1069815 RepID=A0ABD3VFY5_SINWO